MRKLLILGLLLGLSLFVACGDDPEPKVENVPPVIINVQVSPNPAEVGQRITFYVTAKDTNQDALTYAWTLNGPNGAVPFENGVSNEVRVFCVPTVTGIYTATIVVSDPKNLSDTETTTLTVTATPELTVNNTNLNFGLTTTSMTFKISNTGSGPLTATIAENVAWLTVDPLTPPALNPNAEVTINVNVERAEMDSGTYNGTIDITSNGGNATVNVVMQVPGGGSNEPFCLTFPFSDPEGEGADTMFEAGDYVDIEFTGGKMCLTGLDDGYFAWAFTGWNPDFFGDEWTIEMDITCPDPYYTDESIYTLFMYFDYDEDTYTLEDFFRPDDEGDLAQIVGFNFTTYGDGYWSVSAYNKSEDFYTGPGFYRFTDYTEPPDGYDDSDGGTNRFGLMSAIDDTGAVLYLGTINNEIVFGWPVKVPCAGFYFGTANFTDVAVCFDNWTICAMNPPDEEERAKMRAPQYAKPFDMVSKMLKFPRAKLNW